MDPAAAECLEQNLFGQFSTEEKQRLLSSSVFRSRNPWDIDFLLMAVIAATLQLEVSSELVLHRALSWAAEQPPVRRAIIQIKKAIAEKSGVEGCQLIITDRGALYFSGSEEFLNIYSLEECPFREMSPPLKWHGADISGIAMREFWRSLNQAKAPSH